MKKIVVVMMALFAFFAFSVGAHAQDQQSLLNLDFVSQIPDPVEPGKYVDLRWQVENQGGKTQDYVFELRPEYPFMVDGTTTPLRVERTVQGYQGGDETLTLYYRVRVADDAVEGESNDIKLVYKRNAPGAQEIIVEQPVRIQSRQGLVEITNVDLQPDQISVGSRFNISLQVQNLGTTTISNVKVTLDTESTGFTPIGGSNQKIVSLLGGNAIRTMKFEYFADGNVDVKVHAIPVTLEYTDNLGRSNNVTTKIGLPVDSKPVYLSNLENWDVYTPGSKGQIITSISNVGKGDINFVVLELVETDDYTVLSTSKSYLGNLESDDFETGQFDIFVRDVEPGTIPLTFNLYYRDAYDKTYQDTFTIDHRIYSVADAQSLGLVPSPSFAGPIIFVLLVIGIVVFIVLRRRKKAKNQ